VSMMSSVVSARTRACGITEGSWSQYFAVPTGLAIRAQVRKPFPAQVDGLSRHQSARPPPPSKYRFGGLVLICRDHVNLTRSRYSWFGGHGGVER
jgi:hypothetical protein